MDATLALKISTFIGTGYAANVVFMPQKYLEDQGLPKNSETVYMSKGLVGGVLAMVAFSYKAGFGAASSDLVDAAVMANITAFSWWTVSSVNQLFNDKAAKKGLMGPKVDLGICCAMLSMFGSTFM